MVDKRLLAARIRRAVGDSRAVKRESGDQIFVRRVQRGQRHAGYRGCPAVRSDHRTGMLVVVTPVELDLVYSSPANDFRGVQYKVIAMNGEPKVVEGEFGGPAVRAVRTNS